MDGLPDPKRIVGALRFLAELSAVGAELAASRTMHDELTARRLRDEGRVVTPRRAEPHDGDGDAVNAR